MTRLWPAGILINVTGSRSISASSEGNNGDVEPASFSWQGQIHQVAEITRKWRVDIDWWRGRIWRAYFKLRTDTGLLVIIYQDLLNDEWYLQRLYD